MLLSLCPQATWYQCAATLAVTLQHLRDCPMPYLWIGMYQPCPFVVPHPFPSVEKKDKPSNYQHEKSAQIPRFPAKCDAWLGTRANILSIRKDSCNFAAVFTFWETPGVLQKRLYRDRSPNPYHFIHIYRKGISFVCDLLLTNAAPLSLC